VKGIIVHYTGVPYQTAIQCRNYFDSLADLKNNYASTQFIVDGQNIIQTMEENEKAFGVTTPLNYNETPYPKPVEEFFGRSVNNGAIHIEMCYKDKDGKIEEDTLNTTAILVAYLLNKYGLSIKTVFTHNECTGKLCPKYFVENKKAYQDFKNTARRYLRGYLKKDTDILE
jgi:N-acetylmuramoyl-L-alanine amidase CwlA